MRIHTTSGPVLRLVPKVTVYQDFSCECLMFEFGGEDHSVLDIGYKPITTSHGFLNEKGCYHDNLVGDVYLYPKTSIVNYSTYVYPLPTVSEGPSRIFHNRFKMYGWTATNYIGAIIHPGTSFYWSCPRIIGLQGGTHSDILYRVCTGEWLDEDTFRWDLLSVSRNGGSGFEPVWQEYSSLNTVTVFKFSPDRAITKSVTSSASVSGVKESPWHDVDMSKLATVSTYSKNVTLPTSQPTGIPYLRPQKLRAMVPPVTPAQWGDLAAIASDDATALDINTGMFVYQLKELKGLITTFKKVIQKPSPKTVGKAYLAWQYGVAQTVRDVNAVKDAIFAQLSRGHQFLLVRSRGVATPSNNTGNRSFLLSDKLNYKIFYSPKSQLTGKIEKALRDWDLWPTGQNIWDAVPYSFVIDWFLDLEQVFTYYDRIQYMSSVDVLGVTKSRRSEYLVNMFSELPDYYAFGCYRVIAYTRITQEECDPTFLAFKLPNSFRNWAEATALLVSR